MQATSVITPDKRLPINLSSSVAANRAISSNTPVNPSIQIEQIKKSQAADSKQDQRLDNQSQQDHAGSELIVSEEAIESKLDAHVEYEGETQGHRGAISQYLQTQHAAKREEIQQMVGVDIYA